MPSKRARQRITAGSLHVGAVEPILPAGIAARRQHIDPEVAVADRHFGPGVEIGALAGNDDDGGVAVIASWMIVVVGWITVPLTDRATTGGCVGFLVAAPAGAAKAETAAMIAAMPTLIRMNPSLSRSQSSRLSPIATAPLCLGVRLGASRYTLAAPSSNHREPIRFQSATIHISFTTPFPKIAPRRMLEQYASICVFGLIILTPSRRGTPRRRVSRHGPPIGDDDVKAVADYLAKNDGS